MSCRRRCRASPTCSTWGFSKGGSSFADFALGVGTHVIGADWTQVQVSFASQGVGSTGRFAIVYTGPADLANYVGVDTFAVAVPEPETWALMLAGLAGLARDRSVAAPLAADPSLRARPPPAGERPNFLPEESHV